MGSIAASIVHWLIFELTMFINAIGALVTRRAQLNAETFSGNSDKNGATHWTNTNVEIPRPIATAFKLSRKGSAATYRIKPPPTNIEVMIAFRKGRR